MWWRLMSRCQPDQGRARDRSRWQTGTCAGRGREGAVPGESSLGGLCGFRCRARRRSHDLRAQSECSSWRTRSRWPRCGECSSTSLENDRYRVTLDNNGDVASIFDKLVDRELLSAPIRLAISSDHPAQWPAWNMDFEQEQAAPRGFVHGVVAARIKENGAARVTWKSLTPIRRARTSSPRSASPRATPAIA